MPVYLYTPDFLRDELKYPSDVRKADDIVNLLFSTSGVRAGPARYDPNDSNLKGDPKYQTWVNFATAFEQLYISRQTGSAEQGSEIFLVGAILDRLDKEPGSGPEDNLEQKKNKLRITHQIHLLTSKIFNTPAIDPILLKKVQAEMQAEKDDLREIDAVNKCHIFRYDKQYCERDHPKYPGLNCKWVSEDDPSYLKLWDAVRDNEEIKRILVDNYGKANRTSLELYIKKKGYDCLDVKSNMFEDIGSVLQSRAAGGPGGSPGSAQSVPGQGGGRKKKKKTKKKKTKKKKSKRKSKKKKSKKKKSKKR